MLLHLTAMQGSRPLLPLRLGVCNRNGGFVLLPQCQRRARSGSLLLLNLAAKPRRRCAFQRSSLGFKLLRERYLLAHCTRFERRCLNLHLHDHRGDLRERSFVG